jgi:purine-binding chemotaxis protein CheW
MTTDNQDSLLHVCVFRVAGHSFAVTLNLISEIVPMAELSRPPLTPKFLQGFLNIGGTPIPVLRLAELLGLPQDSLELYTPLVILRGQPATALLVKSITGILSTSIATLAALDDSKSFNGCVRGMIAAEGEAVHLISVERLLLEKEQRIIGSFQETESRRLAQADQTTP